MSQDCENCAICLETLDIKEELYELNCKHLFHRDCITKWLHNSPNCPLCRAPVDPDPHYVSDEIMSETRRQEIEELRKGFLLVARGLEWWFPTGLQGFTQHSSQILDTASGKRVLDTVNRDMTPDSKNYIHQLLALLGRCGLV